MEKWDIEDYKELVSIIREVVRKEIKLALKEYGITTTKSAIVEGTANNDGTYNLRIFPDNVLITEKINKTGTTLNDGDSVQLFCKSGSMSNSWIGVKHKT